MLATGGTFISTDGFLMLELVDLDTDEDEKSGNLVTERAGTERVANRSLTAAERRSAIAELSGKTWLARRTVANAITTT